MAAASASTARAQVPAQPTLQPVLPPALTIEALRNATYPVEVVPGGNATLSNGHFEVAAAPGSASKATADFVTAAIGTLGGQPRAAVVIASSGGGSGTFFGLYVMDAAGKTLARSSLGDRVKVNAVSITSNGVVMVDMLTRGAGEPLSSAPAVQVSRAYGVDAAGTLTFLEPFDAPSTPPPVVPAPAPAPAKTGNAGLVRGSGRPGAAFDVTLLALVVAAAWAARGLGGRGGEGADARLAVAAAAVDLQAVRLDLVTSALGDARHQLLHVARGEVADRAAVGADEVVVVIRGAEAVRGAAVVQHDLAHDVEVLE